MDTGGCGHVEGMDARRTEGMDAGQMDAGGYRGDGCCGGGCRRDQGNRHRGVAVKVTVGDKGMDATGVEEDRCKADGYRGEGCRQDRALTCRHVVVVQAQEHFRLQGKKSRMSNSAHRGHAGPDLGRPGVSFPCHAAAQLHGQGGGQVFCPATSREGDLTSALALRQGALFPHPSPTWLPAPAASGCGEGFPVPADAR